MSVALLPETFVVDQEAVAKAAEAAVAAVAALKRLRTVGGRRVRPSAPPESTSPENQEQAEIEASS